MKKAEKEKFCGNCLHHEAYEYPDKIFCAVRLIMGLNPIVPTLWCCEHWKESIDECFCVENAKKVKVKIKS